MPDVLFLELNSSYSHSMLSYGMLRAFTEQYAPEWRWHKIEFTVKNADTAIFEDKISELKPEVICATVYLFNRVTVLNLLKSARRAAPRARIVLGGPEFLGDNRQFLEHNPGINAVIRGDESGFYRYLQHDEVVEGCFDGELDELPSPHQRGYVDPSKPFWQIETSRGCPGRCRFCTSSLSRNVKFYSISRIRADLEALRGYGFQDIRVLDRTFNTNPKRAVELLKLFREEFPEMRFHLEIEPAGLTECFLSELAKAPKNKLHVEAGIQSLDPDVLQACRRFADSDKVLTGLRGLLKCGNFELHVDLIAGLPEQTMKSLIEDVKTVIALCPQEIQLEKLKILPGTPLCGCPDIKHNPEPPYEVISTASIKPAEMRDAMLLSLLLDNFYNARQLHSAFIFGFKKNPELLHKLLNYLSEHESLFASGKPALESRFEIMRKLLPPDSPSSQVLRFAGLCAGIFSTGACRRLCHDSIPTEAELLWSKPVETEPKRFFKAEFSGNAGQCWLQPCQKWESGRYVYYFKLHYGRFPSEILMFKQ